MWSILFKDRKGKNIIMNDDKRCPMIQSATWWWVNLVWYKSEQHDESWETIFMIEKDKKDANIPWMIWRNGFTLSARLWLSVAWPRLALTWIKSCFGAVSGGLTEFSLVDLGVDSPEFTLVLHCSTFAYWSPSRALKDILSSPFLHFNLPASSVSGTSCLWGTMPQLVSGIKYSSKHIHSMKILLKDP